MSTVPPRSLAPSAPPNEIRDRATEGSASGRRLAPANWQDRATGNNFDLLRLLLAIGVVFFHLYVLTRESAYHGLSRLTNGTALVQSFFVISGFFVVMSYDNSKSLADYFLKRLRRIYPAYVVMLLLCFTAGIFLTRLPLAEYFSWTSLKYLAANLTFLVFLQPTLPGVFETHSIQAVNGSLWTLKIEVAYYFSVPLFCWLLHRGHRVAVFVGLYASSVFFTEFELFHGHDTIAKQFPGQVCFFIAGAALYYYFERFAKNAVLWFVLALVVLRVNGIWPVEWLIPASIGVITIFLACFLPKLPGVGRLGDISYGVYIYHFPVIQTLQHFGVYRWNLAAGFALTIGITGVLAFASWHLVEKPFLKKASHYRRAGRGVGNVPAEAPAQA